MVENGRLPAHDLFTYTVPGHIWTDHEYLTEILMWLVFTGAGFAGIAILFGLITFTGFLLLLRTRYSGARPPVIISGLGLVLALIAGAPIWGPRAQMITFCLSCLELYWIAGYLAGRSRAIMWFPLVMAVWANLHAGWVIGLAFLGLALGSECLVWLFGGRSASAAAHCRRLGLVLGLSLVAVMATPHGLSIYLYPFQTQGSAAQQKLIVEWFSPDFHNPELRAFEAMILLLIIGMLVRRPPSLYQLLLSLSVLVLSLQSVRHIALFVAAVTPILVDTYSAIWRDLAASRPRLQARVDRFTTAPSAPLAAVTVAALIVIAGATALRIGTDLSRQTRLNAETYPVAAADWLAAHPEVGTRMYNQYGWGGYLLYRFYPDPNRRVYIFGEAALMGDPLLQRYQDVQTLRPDWQQVLDSDQIDYVVYNRGEALSNVLLTEPGWKVAYDGDPVAIIFVRQPNR